MKETAVKTSDITVVDRSHLPEDEAQFRPLQWGLIKRLFGYTRPMKKKLRRLVLAVTLRSIQLPALVWASSAIIAGPIAGHHVGVLPWVVLGYALLAISTDTVMHWRQRYALELGEFVVNRLRAEIFAKMQSQPMSFFSRMKLGRIISRTTNDVEVLRAGIQDVFFVTLIQAGQMVVTAAVMAWCDWTLFLVVLAMAPILWVINRHFRVELSRLTRASQESFSRVTATLAESVNGIRVTQGFARQETNAGFFRRLLVDHSRYNVDLARTSGMLAPLLMLNSQFFVAILLLFGGWRVFHGDMAMDALIQFFLLSDFFFSPIAAIGNQYNQALLAMAGAERVFRLLDIQPDWVDDPAAADLPDPRQDHGGADAAGMRVEFRDVSFGYDPRTPVLHNVSFTAEPGQTVALVGHTGSGKSSIINLAAKFYLPSAGAVLVDGRDLNRVTGASLHRQLGMVPQQNFLFGGTVRQNIRYGRPEATDAEIEAVAVRLDCLDVFESLPQGLDTEVGERGAALSIGQRQLVCFARALLANPRLVILDEATSSIDALTEARLQKALAALLRGRTSFIVAHRLSTIRHADLLLVLDQGRVIERGRHEELLALGGAYANLYRQFIQVEERH